MPKLNQIIALEQGVKSRAHAEITKQYHLLEKTALWNGLSRTYTPKDAEGEQLPQETTRVQISATDVLTRIGALKTELYDTIATKDWGNCDAKADVMVDGQVVVAQAPVTYLLFLEKELTDLQTFIKKIPTLDATETWRYDQNTDCYVSEPIEKVRTKKTPRTLIKYEATEHHPAQVDVWHEDVPVGTWREVKFSGALPVKRVRVLEERVEKLLDAVKCAREEANSIEVSGHKVGANVFSYLLEE